MIKSSMLKVLKSTDFVSTAFRLKYDLHTQNSGFQIEADKPTTIKIVKW